MCAFVFSCLGLPNVGFWEGEGGGYTKDQMERKETCYTDVWIYNGVHIFFVNQNILSKKFLFFFSSF